MTAHEISMEHHIPLRLTNNLISKLLEAHILTEGATDDEKVITYLPAFDINKMTVGLLFERMEKLGSENFKVDKDGQFKNVWDVVVNVKQKEIDATRDTLIKDL
jgi:membrane protein